MDRGLCKRREQWYNVPIYIFVSTGGILLKIHKMTATFGKLKGQSLELSDGLNIIEAPNESGKSTWCAFLSAMFYGLNTRERGAMAEKNRYAPWSGEAMAGRMDCTIGQREVTLTRSTSRPGAPMADFSAVWGGTNDPIPGITGQNCGDAVLGVPREVFERSAFIRQAGLPIHQDPELEKRIAALLSSGEEDVSCTEALDALKKQLNLRRHNKTGQLPALEAELKEKEALLRDLEDLEQKLTRSRAQARELEGQVQGLEAELDNCQQWEAHQKQAQLQEAEAGASQANSQAEAMRRKLDEARVPEVRDISRLRGALVNIQTARKNAEKAREQRDEAMKALVQAELPTHDSPFADRSAESARREAGKVPPKLSPLVPLLLALALGGLGAVLYLHYGTDLLPAGWFPYLLGGCGGVTAVTLWQLGSHRKQVTALRTSQLRRFGTTDREAIGKMAEDYIASLETYNAAQEDLKLKTAAMESLVTALNENEQAILLEIRRFAPNAHDLTSADQLLRQCAAMRKHLSELEGRAYESRTRRDILGEQLPAFEGSGSVRPPQREGWQVDIHLKQAREQLAAAQADVQLLTGQLRAKGDPVVLRSETAHLREEMDCLQEEYDSLALAISALDAANSSLQSRFSPALGQRTTEIFRQLTGDRYDSVTLDRELNLAVQPEGDPVQRDARQLSGGALDQLYLAARLAICDIVLPQDREIPLILDDALANFDDARCNTVLDWLSSASCHRQVILFTCHSREAAHFAKNDGISVQRLTE